MTEVTPHSWPGQPPIWQRAISASSTVSLTWAAYEMLAPGIFWTGAADDSDWSDPGNWSDDLVPTQQDSVTIASGFNTIQVGLGTYAVGSVTSSSPIEVTSGTLVLYGQTTFNDGLTVDAGGEVQVVADPTVLVVIDLSIVAGGTLDLTDNSKIVHNGDIAAIAALISTGFNGGFWNGTGIISSTAVGTNNTALGVELNSDGQGGSLFTTFQGQPVSSTDVLVRYTYFGDAQLAGSVTAADYALIDNGFNMGLAGWSNGDFNYDGVINGDDYTLIDNAFNTQGSTVQVLARGLPTSNAAQIAAPSSASRATPPDSGTRPKFVAATSSVLGVDNTDGQELKKRRPSAWETLEASPS